MVKVSVIIPAYNSMKYLPESLASVFRQSFTNWEVIIVNDGSSDHIVEWFTGIKDTRVKLISQPNQGVSVARNTGIVNSQGEYIAFLDADDIWEATKLEEQVVCLDNNSEVGLVHTWWAVINPESKPTGRLMKFNTEGNVWKELVERNTLACSSVILRRSCLDVGLFTPGLNFAEDWDLWLRIAATYPFKLIKKPLLLYRQHPNNCIKNWQVVEQDYRRVIEKTFQSAPIGVQYLKEHSYGHANLFLAWSVLLGSYKDYKKASEFRRQALIHYPGLRYSHEYIRLSLAIALMQFFGADGYGKVLKLAFAVRRRVSGFAR